MLRLRSLHTVFAQEARHWLDFDKRLGIPNQVVFHLYIWFFVLIAVARLLVYEVEIFGTYNKGRGLTNIYVQMWPTPGVVALYL